ncbi:aldo/keto reductase [bacterium]|nr:aldo/keto reductase [bacterium]
MPDKTLMPGRATAEGTARYVGRFPDFPVGTYRERLGLHASSIGMGTYLGEPEESDVFQSAIAKIVTSGVNVFDTAINYRCQMSERDLGKAIRAAVDAGEIQRDEIIVSTKGGFLPLDFEQGMDNPRQYLTESFLKSGLCPQDEIAGGCQCIAPAYIEDQIERSRRNLGLETIDIYYLHNVEMQFAELPRADVLSRIKAAFDVLAQKVVEGEIGWYGVATWNGLRQEADSQERLDLDELERLAVEVEGPNHHFAAVQLPVNLMMSEALRIEHDPEHHPGKNVLQVADELELFVMTSASIMQGKLAGGLPAALQQVFPGLDTDAQRALQHTRSAAGVTTALVGMKNLDHVRENLALLAKSRVPESLIARLYGATG